MKIFILLFFSGFVYAQQPQNNTDDSAQQNNRQETTQEQKAPEATPQAEKEEQEKEEQKQTPTPPPTENQEPKSAEQEPKSAEKEEQVPAEDKDSASPATQMVNDSKTVTAPAQPLPSEEPIIPYYNPLHPQSPSVYQEGDLPSEEVYDMASGRKKRKHRFSVGGKILDYHVQCILQKININASADYGYSHKYFEVGPYASMELSDFDTRDLFVEEVMFSLGAFFEVNFMANSNHAKNVPSIGLKAGYKRKENVNYIVGQPYVTMKFFFNHQTAFFVSLAPYYQYKLAGGKGEWGVEIPTGLRFYFH